MKPAKYLLGITLLSLLAAWAHHPDGALLTQQQGSLPAGGTVATAPGTFNPHQPMTPNGQTYHDTHFPMSDLNNVQITDLVVQSLKNNGLD